MIKPDREARIKVLINEKRRLRHLYHQPENRRMNGKPTHEAFEKYGRRIYEIEGELIDLGGLVYRRIE
jgi:hypothetical protein